MTAAATIAAPPAQTPATASEMPPAPRVALGPNHKDYGKPDTRETRQCAREGCPRTFTARSDQAHRRFCSAGCGVRESWRLRRAASPQKPLAEPKPKRVAWREQRVCPACGRTFMVSASIRRQRYCDRACSAYGRHGTRHGQATETAAPAVVLSPDGHDLAACPNLCCADRRRAAGRAPLPVRIGGRVFPALSSGGGR